MRARFGMRAGVAAALLGLALDAAAAEPQLSDVLAEIKRLQKKVEQLEKNNTELEKRLQGAAPDPALAQRVKQLEETAARTEEALGSERLSQAEPELVTRLKAVETQALSMQKQARAIEALEGVTAGVSLTMVGQGVDGVPAVPGADDGQLNYRGDVFVTLPGGEIGNTEGNLFFQMRVGQGDGVNPLTPAFSVPNATAFKLGGADDDSTVLLAQAWYQLDVPLPLGGVKERSREHLEINFGKMDPFVFFDQNAAADDETAKFMNLAFVHNPLLDAGGGAGIDAYGFTPGIRLAYLDDTIAPESWGVSLGVFGAGEGATFENNFEDPFIIAQLETRRKLFEGLDGNYRLYYWHNGRATPFNNGASPETESQSGIGLSVDQRLGDAVTLFGRYGYALSGHWTFDQALTLGAEFGGTYWNRSADGIGFAYGWLPASDDFQAVSQTLDADGDGVPDFGYAAAGAEHVFELYYRWRFNPNFELTPDLQFIQRPAADGGADDVLTFGLRAQLNF